MSSIPKWPMCDQTTHQVCKQRVALTKVTLNYQQLYPTARDLTMLVLLLLTTVHLSFKENYACKQSQTPATKRQGVQTNLSCHTAVQGSSAR
eukprot:5575513-Amphidinium_carterae.1